MTINRFFIHSLPATRINTDEVTLKEKILGYFTAPFLAFLSHAVFGSYLNRYYSDIIGWTDTSLFGKFSALLPVISVLFVIGGNLLAGYFIDRTRTGQGKARPSMFLSAPLVAGAITLLFLIPGEARPPVKMIWIALSYNFYYALAFPVYYTSHSSLVALSTRNPDSRGVLATLSNASAVAASGLGAGILVPLLLQGFLFREDEGVLDTAVSYQNWKGVMFLLSGITLCAVLLEYFYTRERVTEESGQPRRETRNIPLRQQISACARSKYWWMIILYFFLFQWGGLIKNSSMTYYCRWMFDAVGDEGSAGYAMGTLGLVGGMPTALGMFAAWPIARRLGKRKAIAAGLVISVIGSSVSFFDVHSFALVCTGRFFKSIGHIPAMYVSLALLSDVLDHLEAKNGFRSDGFTMSVYGSIMVGMTGLGNGFFNLLLTVSGYNPLADSQSRAVEFVLGLSYLGVDKICYAAIAVLLLFMDVEKHLEADQRLIKERRKEVV